MPNVDTPRKMITKEGKRIQTRYVQKEKIISLLAAGVAVSEISSQCKVGRSTIYKLLKDNDFRSQVEAERELINFDAVQQAASVVSNAVKVVADAINDGDEALAFNFLKECGVLRTTGSKLGMEQKSANGQSSGGITINLVANGQGDAVKVIEAENCADNDQ